jgi:hypothetical protein
MENTLINFKNGSKKLNNYIRFISVLFKHDNVLDFRSMSHYLGLITLKDDIVKEFQDLHDEYWENKNLEVRYNGRNSKTKNGSI